MNEFNSYRKPNNQFVSLQSKKEIGICRKKNYLSQYQIVSLIYKGREELAFARQHFPKVSAWINNTTVAMNINRHFSSKYFKVREINKFPAFETSSYSQIHIFHRCALLPSSGLIQCWNSPYNSSACTTFIFFNCTCFSQWLVIVCYYRVKINYVSY